MISVQRWMPAAKSWIFRGVHNRPGRDAASGIRHRGHMSPESERLVRESWEILLPAGDAVVASFYARLFESNPELEKLFRPTDMKEQRRKFIVMLSEIVRVIDTPDLLVSEVADSGRRHVAYGVQDRDYEDVGAALLWAIGEALGDRSTSGNSVGVARSVRPARRGDAACRHAHERRELSRRHETDGLRALASRVAPRA